MSNNMKHKKLFLLSILTISLVMISGYFIIHNYGGGSTRTTYKTLIEAEKDIGKIPIINIPHAYKIDRIEYNDDDFTTPTTSVYYTNNTSNESILFIITSDYAGVKEYENIKTDKACYITWITDHDIKIKGFENSYILKWKKTRTDKTRYLFTNNIKDKDWLISLVEQQ